MFTLLISLVPISQRTLVDLQFEKVLQALADRCRTEPGKKRALARVFFESRESASNEFRRIDEIRSLHQEPLTLPLGGLTDVSLLTQRAARGAMLEPPELIAITHCLFAFEHTRQTLEDRRQHLPELNVISQGIPQLEKLATKLERAFEPDGTLSDRASPALHDARERTRGLHKNIKVRIDKLLQDEKFGFNLQEPYFSVRHDRYVFPVQAQHRGQVPGIVHNASQTGQTLFIEPQELIGIGNELAIAQSLVLEEERRVLQELSSAVGRVATPIEEGLVACAILDELEACGRLAADLDAQNPSLGDDVLSLKCLRHPLLALQKQAVVGNDVHLSAHVQALMISGPNAGGKTVTITGVGLCALMCRAGLPIPVESNSQMPWFESVFSAVGDAQDLTQGLSTFSAHVKELADIASQIGPNSLVLIDEIAADTDPKEGAAIAIAVLEDLLEHGATLLVTTHLEELKALAHLDKRFMNARVGFDTRQMAPTYRLQFGEAGTSSAIEIASRMGMKPLVVERARHLLKGAGGPLAKALTALDDERKQLHETRLQLENTQSETALLKTDLQQQMQDFEKKRYIEESKFRQALMAELEFAQAQVRQLLSHLHEEESIQAAEHARKELAARRNEQQESLVSLQHKITPPPEELIHAPLKVGSWAKHLKLGREVEILEIQENEALVAAGAIKLRASLKELMPTKSARAVPAFPTQDKATQRLTKATQVKEAPLAVGSASLDLRGTRAEEALNQLDAFLDRLTLEGEPQGLVLHGLGTGALKHSIREHLRASPYIQSFRPGEGSEGGDAVTIVVLKA